MNKYCLKLSPSVTRKIWGGKKLGQLKDISSSPGDLPIGETWEISTHQDGQSCAHSAKLGEIFDSGQIPYLAKLIDTSDNLSVQVHPGDDYAQRVESSLGKTECWIILDAKDGEGIYLGLKDGVKKEEFEKSLSSGENMADFLNFYPVKRGDFFYVPAGTIHAIGKDVFLAEVQQSSGITYRVWDWNRVDSAGKSRELHMQKALDVIDFSEPFNSAENFRIQKDIFSNLEKLELVDHSEFNLCAHRGNAVIEKSVERVNGLICLSGELSVNIGEESLSLKAYESGIIVTEGDNFKVVASGEYLSIK